MNPQTTHPLQQLTSQDWLAMGLNEVAYVRPVVVNGAAAWGVFAANGEALTVAPNRDVAFAAIRQHDMEPLSVH